MFSEEIDKNQGLQFVTARFFQKTHVIVESHNIQNCQPYSAPPTTISQCWNNDLAV